MARADHVYIIKGAATMHILGVFTAKHEALSALHRVLPNEPVQLWRHPDGVAAAPTLMGEGRGRAVSEELQ